MSDSNSEGENFPDFLARDDPEEGGLTTNEMIMGLGFMLIVVGFILGLIRLMGLKGITWYTNAPAEEATIIAP